MKIVIELPSKNEALITVITMALFLLLTGVFIGLRSCLLYTSDAADE